MAARVRPVARATSDSVSDGVSAPNARITASPRSSDCTKCAARPPSSSDRLVAHSSSSTRWAIANAALAAGHARVDGGVQQHLGDLLRREPVAQRGAHVQLELALGAHGGQRGERDHAALAAVEARAGSRPRPTRSG